MIDDFLKELKTALKNELPGNDAQRKMAPSLRIPAMSVIAKRKARESSVMILLYKNKQTLNTVFILRASNGPHAGEISLPGGKAESSDTSSEHTAIRECQEEIGAPGDKIGILGRLTDLYVPFSNFLIHPIVGYLDSRPEFTPNIGEVRKIIEVSLGDLFALENRLSKRIRLAFFKIHAPYYKLNNEHVWGATAMIMSEFNELVTKLPSFEKLKIHNKQISDPS